MLFSYPEACCHIFRLAICLTFLDLLVLVVLLDAIVTIVVCVWAQVWHQKFTLSLHCTGQQTQTNSKLAKQTVSIYVRSIGIHLDFNNLLITPPACKANNGKRGKFFAI